MRKYRYQRGSVKKQRDRWVAMWWVGLRRKGASSDWSRI